MFSHFWKQGATWWFICSTRSKQGALVLNPKIVVDCLPLLCAQYCILEESLYRPYHRPLLLFCFASSSGFFSVFCAEPAGVLQCGFATPFSLRLLCDFCLGRACLRCLGVGALSVPSLLSKRINHQRNGHGRHEESKSATK